MSNNAPDYCGAENVVCHCNLKENADLIAKIMDADCDGEVFERDKGGRMHGERRKESATESEAFMAAQLKVKDEATRIVNEVVHKKVQMLIADAPTVDAVPVVRCRECKNYDAEIAWCKIHSCFINSNGDFCHPWESNEWKMFDGAYYCADGERREENGTD